MQVNLIKHIKKFGELKELTIPVFIFTPKVLNSLGITLLSLRFMQSLIIWSDKDCVVSKKLTVDSSLEFKANLMQEPFSFYTNFVIALRKSLVLVRLGFSSYS